jgi:hypothetical protein
MAAFHLLYLRMDSISQHMVVVLVVLLVQVVQEATAAALVVLAAAEHTSTIIAQTTDKRYLDKEMTDQLVTDLPFRHMRAVAVAGRDLLGHWRPAMVVQE